MKKIRRILISLALVFVALITLASCSKVSQSYVDKVNKAAEKEEYVTYETAKKDIGDECFDLTVLGSGVLVAVKGYKNDITWEQLDEKLDNLDKDTKISCIIVVSVLGKCTSAIYVTGTASEVEAKIEAAVAGKL
ncbi:MAG: hypothetical protein IKP77_00305 [Acholeplasmatales bacterium]|nr:hypothetical protein [Acholeplasmatales bacterium]